MEVKQRIQPKKEPEVSEKKPTVTKKSGSVLSLIICVLGIYVSFLSWAVLQERISTTPYGPDNRIFRGSYTITLVQSTLAMSAGYIFLKIKGDKNAWPANPKIKRTYLLIALCHSLSTPLSYASLKYVDYVTLLLAKSCKLLPVMAVHLTVYRRKFPAYKYAVVFLVTAGVFLFSLYQSSANHKKSGNTVELSTRLYGFLLLGLSLFLDGLYNTSQDDMFHKYGKTGEVSGPKMMFILNKFAALFAIVNLLVNKAHHQETIWFLRHHPMIFRDIVLFGACGALGQIFIFITLEQFGSLVLVTTTVTRKMMSMLLSVVMFNHKLTGMQWVGVLLVFGGIAGETLYKIVK